MFRERPTAQIQKLKDENERLKSQLEQQERLAAEQQKQIDSMKQLCDELGQQCDLATQSVNLPHDQPIGTHGYGVRMITVAVNLARAVGLRGADRVRKFFFEWLGLRQKTPSRTSIRNWLQRLGIGRMKEPLGDNEDLVFMADHSNQIGTEKVLAVLGVKASAMPVPGQALRHEHVHQRKSYAGQTCLGVVCG